MSLILAIEPDRRQVAHLISIVRHVQGAELILADTTERALESIGNSVPDLILVPALLSPQDDAALAAALRVIATAAHVQMLTIPTFAAPKPKPKRGVLSAFRRKQAEDTPIEGCDPKVFAEEIASYLERASEERAAAQFYEDEPDAVRPEPLRAEAPGSNANDAFETFAEEPADALVEEDAEPERVTVFEASEPAVEPIVETCEPIVEEVYAAPEAAIEAIDAIPEPELVAEPLPVEEPEAAPEMRMAAAPAMALDEVAATLEQTPPVVEEEPVAVEDVVPVAAAPEFEDLLADFERTNLPVIEEVHADQWMAETVDAKSDALEDEADLLDIDLSIELDTAVEAEEPALAAAPEPARALKPFEPVVPVERVEPFPLAAWQAWPRLDWTPPAKPAALDAHAGNGNGKGNGNGNGHHQPDASEASNVADVDQAPEFEVALEAEASLAIFEPVVPVERFEPMPMAAWQAWPRLEGVVAEAYQEPIAPRKAAAKPEWVELMRSLREDIARRRTELAASGPVAAPAKKPQRPRAPEPRVQAAKPAPAPAPEPATEPDEARKPRPKRTRPIEDEWGLFDPEQCGFAALLNKLDEITVTPPSAPPSAPPRRPER
jgi:hypothetical protein